MRTNWGFSAGMVLVAVCALAALAGCGTGPIEQSYATQSGAEPINAGIGDAKDMPELMKQMRFAMLNLSDRLSSGSPEQIVRAAVQVNIIAREMANYQPAIAYGSVDDGATLKRYMYNVQDMAVEVAKAADNGQMRAAQEYYFSLYRSYTAWQQLWMGSQRATEPMEIPELAEPKPAVEPEMPSVPMPAPSPAPAPMPEIPQPPNP